MSTPERWNCCSERMGLQVIGVDASKRFLDRLSGVTDPEEKRKRIGAEFIAVFDEQARELASGPDRAAFLVQGTLYPDVIESVAVRGPSQTIKTHHNVGGLPKDLPFSLIEPLRELFKDEVRRIGRELGLPEEMLTKQPFPGPGLAVRLLGEVRRPIGNVARRRRYRSGRFAAPVYTKRLASLCGAAAGAQRGCNGRRAGLRVYYCCTSGGFEDAMTAD